MLKKYTINNFVQKRLLYAFNSNRTTENQAPVIYILRDTYKDE